MPFKRNLCCIHSEHDKIVAEIENSINESPSRYVPIKVFLNKSNIFRECDSSLFGVCPAGLISQTLEYYMKVFNMHDKGTVHTDSVEWKFIAYVYLMFYEMVYSYEVPLLNSWCDRIIDSIYNSLVNSFSRSSNVDYSVLSDLKTYLNLIRTSNNECKNELLSINEWKTQINNMIGNQQRVDIRTNFWVGVYGVMYILVITRGRLLKSDNKRHEDTVQKAREHMESRGKKVGKALAPNVMSPQELLSQINPQSRYNSQKLLTHVGFYDIPEDTMARENLTDRLTSRNEAIDIISGIISKNTGDPIMISLLSGQNELDHF